MTDRQDENKKSPLGSGDNSKTESEATTPLSSPRKNPIPSGAMASPAQSSAVTITGGGKRQRIESGNRSQTFAPGPFGALGAVPPSPPKFASLEEIVSAATGVKNMVRFKGLCRQGYNAN